MPSPKIVTLSIKMHQILFCLLQFQNFVTKILIEDSVLKLILEVIRIEKEIVILIGIPGAGKSTFYKKYFSDYGYINLDTIKNREKEAKLVKSLLDEGKNLVVDNTNCSNSDRKRYIPEAKEKGYKVIGYYFEPDYKSCMKRNNRRKEKSKVPECRMQYFYYLLLCCTPSYNEGFDELYVVINDNKDMIVKEYKN